MTFKSEADCNKRFLNISNFQDMQILILKKNGFNPAVILLGKKLRKSFLLFTTKYNTQTNLDLTESGALRAVIFVKQGASLSVAGDSPSTTWMAFKSVSIPGNTAPEFSWVPSPIEGGALGIASPWFMTWVTVWPLTNRFLDSWTWSTNLFSLRSWIWVRIGFLGA